MNLPKLLFRLFFGRRLPSYRGTFRVTGLQQAVAIHRDRFGIPTIVANTAEDAWFGLGFCHGQDRPFQVETLYRLARGTLAELVGPAAVPVDRIARRIGFRYAAIRQWEILPEVSRGLVSAYTKGVNAGIASLARKPHEFLLLGGTPCSAWDGIDVFAFLKFQSFLLSSNWDVELARLRIMLTDGPDALKALDPTTHLDAFPYSSVRSQAMLDAIAADLAALQQWTHSGGGSNNWAIAGKRTASGRPILANDPHLAPVAPSQWYLVGLRTPLWKMAGVSMVGVPGVQVGHNGTAAWGVTVALADNTDWFIERIGSDGASYFNGQEFVQATIREEVIRVRGTESVTERILETPRGPIVTPCLKTEDQTDWPALALRAVWLDPAPVAGFLGIPPAKTFEEFRQPFAQWPALPLNLVYADTSGTIAWQMVGELPRRKTGFGTLPTPAWTPNAGWEATTIPFDDMPRLVNPDSGLVASANDPPIVNPANVWMGGDYMDRFRGQRIREVLAERTGWTLAQTLELQLDLFSIPWREMRERILALPVATAEARRALELLRDWDGRLAAESAAATVWELFLVEMIRRSTVAKAPQSAAWVMGTGATLFGGTTFNGRQVAPLVQRMKEQPEGWFARSWSEEMADALTQVVASLQTQLGPDSSQWAWGKLRMLTLKHPLFGSIPPWQRIFNLGPFPQGGDSNTVFQAGVKIADPTRGVEFFPAVRMVADVGQWSSTRWMLCGGQSGNPFSPHFADLLPSWQSGEGVPIAWTDAELNASTRHTLYLEPRTDKPL